ncbi:MAG: hypothetical protein ABW143_09030 [Acidimicrobiales bacterium]
MARRAARPLTTTEIALADGLLDEASALVIGHLGCDPTEDDVVPDDVAIVVSRMTWRVIERGATLPAGAEQATDQAGPFSRTVTYASAASSGSPWLTKTDKVTLRPYACGSGSIAIDSGRTGRYRTEV